MALLDEVTEEHIGYQILKSACMIHLGEKVSEAHRILDDVLLRCPENEFTIYAKGLAYYHEEQWEDAAKCFAQARAMNDTNEMERAEVMLEKAQDKIRAAAEEAGESPKFDMYPNYRHGSPSSSSGRGPGRRFGCELCNHFFGKKFNLDRHNRSIHNRKTPSNFPTTPEEIAPKVVTPPPVLVQEGGGHSGEAIFQSTDDAGWEEGEMQGLQQVVQEIRHLTSRNDPLWLQSTSVWTVRHGVPSKV